MVEPRITMKIVDMETRRVLYAQQIVRQYVLAGHYSEKAIASHLKRKFDEAFGPTWHCIAGSNFGSFISNRQGHFLYFYLDNIAVMLFKAA
uniref:Dynein light chain n=1 Tax=Steinernema glaseri TaxID=37863 RepID=A0A1I7ZZW3_9BILA